MITRFFAILITCWSLMAFTIPNSIDSKLVKLQVVNKMNASVKQIYLYDDEGNEFLVLSQGTEIKAGQSLEITLECGTYTVSVESGEGQFCDYYNFNTCQKDTWELTECEEK